MDGAGSRAQVDIGGGLLWSAVPLGFVRCGDRVIAGTDLNGFPVIYSDDNGVSWNPGNLGSTTYSDYGKRFVKVSEDHLLTTTTLADFGSVKLVGTQNGFATGSIYRSSDGGTSYSAASFSNTVAFGYAGLSGNYPEHFWQVGTTLWADMNAG